MERVSTLALGLVSKKWVLSAEDTSRPVSITTTASVGEAGPWPKIKALSVSDQKYDAAISSDSFLCISAIDNLMHWSSFLSSHWTSFKWLTLKKPILPSHGRTGPATEGVPPQIQRKVLGSKGDSVCFCVNKIGGIWIP